MMDAIYATVVSVTTVGYGDLPPTSNSAKIFAATFIPFGVAFNGLAIDALHSSSTNRRLDQFGAAGDRAQMNSAGPTHSSPVTWTLVIVPR